MQAVFRSLIASIMLTASAQPAVADETEVPPEHPRSHYDCVITRSDTNQQTHVGWNGGPPHTVFLPGAPYMRLTLGLDANEQFSIQLTERATGKDVSTASVTTAGESNVQFHWRESANNVYSFLCGTRLPSPYPAPFVSHGVTCNLEVASASSGERSVSHFNWTGESSLDGPNHADFVACGNEFSAALASAHGGTTPTPQNASQFNFFLSRRNRVSTPDDMSVAATNSLNELTYKLSWRACADTLVTLECKPY